jgi:hypothetical protein
MLIVEYREYRKKTIKQVLGANLLKRSLLNIVVDKKVFF